jgi:integrase
MPKSTKPQRPRKAADRPKKPYPDFPLYPHPLGYWSKKIRGTIRHFGRWGRVIDGKLTALPYEENWQEALALYKAQADDLHAGRTPRVTGDRLTVKDLCNAFLTAKNRKVAAGELGPRMFEDYREITDLLVAAFGKDRVVDDLAADDFERLRAAMAERWGPVRLGNAITRVKSVFKYGTDNGLMEKVVRYGSEFRKPDKAVLRRHRAKNGQKMLEADQVRRLVDAADVQLRAMILLGVNAGFGNHDVATLPLSALDLDRGWVNFPRPKTGIERRCPLWPKTVAALREAITSRPEPRRDEGTGLVFINSRGSPWVCTTEKSRTDNVSVQFRFLMKRVGVHRKGVGFYTLRHVFRTAADAARDPVAIDLIMGHSDPTMGGHYRERIEDSRLQAVVEHVRQWLLPTENPTGTTPESSEAGDHGDPPMRDEVGNARPTLRLFAG